MNSAFVNHVGLGTPEIFPTIDWYGSVLGFELIMGPRVLEPEGASAEVRQIFGPRMRKAYQAHLLSAEGIGLELFQFVDPVLEPADAAPSLMRLGLSHLCLTVADVEATVGRVLEGGGTKITDPADFVPGRPRQLAYCRDPWGNPIELMSAAYASVFGGWPQPGMEMDTRMLARDGSEYVIPAAAE